VKRPDQYVLLSFDGSKSVPFWKESRQYAADNDIKFTYFASGVYFLAAADKNNYVEPQQGKGKSAIGFGGTKTDIQPRIEQVHLAMEDGHELGSHANSHFNGAAYTRAQWNSEFKQFADLMSNVWDYAGVSKKEPTGWKSYFQNEVVGFRAPQLGVGTGLWGAMQDNSFMYDCSRVDKMSYWPTKKINGIWDFPLVGLTIAGTTKKTLSMDYNFYVGQSKGVDGPASKFQEYEDQMYNTYIGYFRNNYYGNRAPMHIGHHFSKWNGGAYWKAMQRFATEVCSQPEVKCVTYKELVDFVTENEANIAAYQKTDFDKMIKPGGLDDKLSSTVKELTDTQLEELRLGAGAHFNAHEGEEH
jgi:peptidoglycan/xylan/chitin deacetylase (PgdA/CDA1 family)